MGDTAAPKVIRESEISTFSVSPALAVKELLNETGFPFSVARIVITGTNELTINLHCDTTYFVLDGKGRFVVNGIEHQVEAGSLVVIPKEIPYQDFGEPTLGLLVISSPRFPGNLDND